MIYRQFVSRPSSSPLPAESSAAQRQRRLSTGTSVEDVANACRAAVLAFLDESRSGFWSPNDYTRWRIGPYERALIASHIDAPVSTMPPPPMPSQQFLREVRKARARTLEIIRLCTRHPSNRFAETMQSVGAVDHIHDAYGGVGWAPAARPGLTLTEQLGTLVIADCLTRPRDYENVRIHSDRVFFDE